MVNISYETAYVGQRVRLTDKATVRKGHFARVAYIGQSGVSVYLEDGNDPLSDECLAMRWDEVEEVKDGKEH